MLAVAHSYTCSSRHSPLNSSGVLTRLRAVRFAMPCVYPGRLRSLPAVIAVCTWTFQRVHSSGRVLSNGRTYPGEML